MLDIIELIERLQNELRIPDCFELSQEKLMSDDTLSNLVQSIACDCLNIGDRYALYEIIKQWIQMKKEEQS